MKMQRLGWAFLIGSMFCNRAEAVFTFTFNQVGSDVVATGAGSLDIAGLGFYKAGAQVRLEPEYGDALLGPKTSVVSTTVYFSAAQAFGSGSAIQVFGTGSEVGFFADSSTISVPDGYVSNTPLTSSTTFRDASIASLGLAVGTFTYAYSIEQGGPILDSFVIQVVPAGVPEPSSLALCGIAGVASLSIARVRRRVGQAVHRRTSFAADRGPG